MKDNKELGGFKMPRVTHKGAISFGLVHIPVGLYKATQDNDIKFNQLCKEDHSRIQYKKICSGCKKEVQANDIVKGFRYSDTGDDYVIMTDDDFEKAKSEKDRGIHILHFADLDGVRPIYYDQSYHIAPEAGGDKAFSLLRQAMLDEKKIAIAKTVIGNSGKLLIIMPTDEGMLIETLYYEDEIREMPKSITTDINDAELKVAKQLIASMVQDFDPSLYKDEYQFRLKEIIESKIQGKEVVSSTPEREANIIDIMEALQASLKEEKSKKSSQYTRKKSG